MDLAALTGGTRAERRAALASLEQALRTEGHASFRLSDVSGSADAIARCYFAAAEFFRRPEGERFLYVSSACDCALGLTYLPLGSEPVYNEAASGQRVHSLNAQASLTTDEVNALLPSSVGETDRLLASEYHAWPRGELALPELEAASSALRSTLVGGLCRPLMKALGSLLGLPDDYLVGRCSVRQTLLLLLTYRYTAAGLAQASHSNSVPGGRTARAHTHVLTRALSGFALRCADPTTPRCCASSSTPPHPARPYPAPPQPPPPPPGVLPQSAQG